MKLSFVKMHGLGNDFVLIDALDREIDISPDTAKRLCDRHFGVGADQTLLLRPSSKADFEMVIYNADGGQAEMCGNAIRCAALYMRDRRGLKDSPMKIETLGGIIKPAFADNGLITVDMGKPSLKAESLPSAFQGEVMGHGMEVLDKTFDIHLVSMGNPHCVIFVHKIDGFPVAKYGSPIENSKEFPKGINVEFVEVQNRKSITVKVWERGSGETLACGTGACAAVVVSSKLGHIDSEAEVMLPGGKLSIALDPGGHIFMTGPAAFVYDGEMEL